MSESYNHHEFGSYSPVPELSPYAEMNEDRLQNPKFIFRFMFRLQLMAPRSRDHLFKAATQKRLLEAIAVSGPH